MMEVLTKMGRTWPDVERTCEICGGTFVGKSNSRFCPPCGLARRREAGRKRMAETRAAAGKPDLKREANLDAERVCKICGMKFIGKYNSCYCKECGTKHRNESKRQANQRMTERKRQARQKTAESKPNIEQCEGCIHWGAMPGLRIKGGCHCILDTGHCRERDGDKCLSKQTGKRTCIDHLSPWGMGPNGAGIYDGIKFVEK